MKKPAFAAAAGLGLAAAGRKTFQRMRQADVRDQVALITGASRGLGYLLARELGREGCQLVICARDAQELQRAREDLAQDGAEVLAIPCDIADRGQVEEMVADATRRFGRVDILVNNAGIIAVGPMHTMTLQDYQDAMNVMFWGALYTILAVLPQMRQRHSGRIVTITSIGGKVSVPHLLPYACAKFAAVGLSEGLRAELARDGIAVTTIVPGLMRTGSDLNALFKGWQEGEFIWFAIGDSLPFISMDAERAAAQIVQALKRGDAERILSLPATLIARVHGLFPGLTADVLGLVNRVLPDATEAQTARARGMEVQQRMNSGLLNTLIAWSLSSARHFHQYPGPFATTEHTPRSVADGETDASTRS